MNRISLLPRLRRTACGLFAIAIGASQAFADQLERHQQVVSDLIAQGVAPVVADCAAHASFVVPTSPRYDRVEFPPQFLDSSHATIEPWSGPFDSHKQKTEVDTVVSVKGLGYTKSGPSGQPDLLSFRCGYLNNTMLAFGYDGPANATPAAQSTSPQSRRATSRRSSTKAKTSTRKASSAATSKRSTKSTKSAKTGAKSTSQQ